MVDRSDHHVLALEPRQVLRALLPVALVLTLASLAATIAAGGHDMESPFLTVLDVDRELTIPTWFQTMVLAACALALWSVGVTAARRGLPWRWHWRLLAVVFAFLSMDEMVGLHERVGRKVHARFDLSGILYFSWVVLAVPLVVMLGVVLWRFLRALPRPTLLLFLLTGAIYLAGSVGLEMVGGHLATIGSINSPAYTAEAHFEELFEMLGMIGFLAAVSDVPRRLPLRPVAQSARAGVTTAAENEPQG